MKAYLAGSIFYYGDYLRNKEWAAKIRRAFPSIDLYSPIENTDINGVEGKKKFAGSREVATADNKRLDETDVLIACIDGDVLPSGTCAEIGKFHEKIMRGERRCLIGICTDNRQCALTHSAAKDEGGAESLGEQQYSYQNIYVTGLIKEAGFLVSSIDEVIELMSLIDPPEKSKERVRPSVSQTANKKEDSSIPIINHDRDRASRSAKAPEQNTACAKKPEDKTKENGDAKRRPNVYDEAAEAIKDFYGFADKYYGTLSSDRVKSALNFLINMLLDENRK